VVFIFRSLDLILYALTIQNNKINARIIGFLLMMFNFILMMWLIHNGDK
jgi:hypothetical protein